MPWCPKCKSEYRDGFSICADCGSELVDEETFARLETERFAAGRIVPVQKADMDADAAAETEFTENGMDSGLRADREDSCAPEAGAEEKGAPLSGPQTKSTGYSSLYRDNAERASENRSSAWVLMAVGGLGIVALIMGITGVIPLHFSNAYLFYGVMAAVFILFLVAGIISMKNALIFEKSAESENSVKKALLDWCRQNLRKEELDRQIGIGGTAATEEGAAEMESEEILYFRRFEAIKARLNHQFLNLDQGFLEKLIDDTVYEMVYSDEEETA